MQELPKSQQWHTHWKNCLQVQWGGKKTTPIQLVETEAIWQLVSKRKEIARNWVKCKVVNIVLTWKQTKKIQRNKCSPLEIVFSNQCHSPLNKAGAVVLYVALSTGKDTQINTPHTLFISTKEFQVPDILFAKGHNLLTNSGPCMNRKPWKDGILPRAESSHYIFKFCCLEKLQVPARATL